jgi:hypothetical protein
LDSQPVVVSLLDCINVIFLVYYVAPKLSLEDTEKCSLYFRTHFKRLMVRSLLSSTAPLANVAFADTNSAADSVVADAISQIQGLMVSISQGCSGGPHGVPPTNWTDLQPHGNTNARLALAKGQSSSALQQIGSAEGELDALVNGVHNGCSGGHGEDPTSYANNLAIRATVEGKLDVVKLFLGS